MPRTEVVKELWSYIKKNGLQDPKDKRFIVCDPLLKRIFDCERVHQFGKRLMRD